MKIISLYSAFFEKQGCIMNLNRVAIVERARGKHRLLIEQYGYITEHDFQIITFARSPNPQFDIFRAGKGNFDRKGGIVADADDAIAGQGFFDAAVPADGDEQARALNAAAP